MKAPPAKGMTTTAGRRASAASSTWAHHPSCYQLHRLCCSRPSAATASSQPEPPMAPAQGTRQKPPPLLTPPPCKPHPFRSTRAAQTSHAPPPRTVDEEDVDVRAGLHHAQLRPQREPQALAARPRHGRDLQVGRHADRQRHWGAGGRAGAQVEPRARAVCRRAAPHAVRARPASARAGATCQGGRPPLPSAPGCCPSPLGMRATMPKRCVACCPAPGQPRPRLHPLLPRFTKPPSAHRF